MKEVIVHPTPTLHTTIHEVPIPSPGPDDVVVKVLVAGSNPKGEVILLIAKIKLTNVDWSHLTSAKISLNSGDDFAGTVHSLGSNVQVFKVGDRVAAFHQMMAPHGAFAEYALAPQHTVFKIPDHMSFEGLSTLSHRAVN